MRFAGGLQAGPLGVRGLRYEPHAVIRLVVEPIADFASQGVTVGVAVH
jgi:hypothetical protein